MDIVFSVGVDKGTKIGLRFENLTTFSIAIYVAAAATEHPVCLFSLALILPREEEIHAILDGGIRLISRVCYKLY